MMNDTPAGNEAPFAAIEVPAPGRVIATLALLLFVLNLAVKLPYVRQVNTVPLSDEQTYLDDVDQIRRLLGGDRTEFRLDHPLYATFLFAVGIVSDSRPALQRKARRVQAILASTVPVLLFLIGVRFLPVSVAFLAGVATSLDYLLNAYSASILTETLFTFVFYSYLLHLSGLLLRRELPGWRGALLTATFTAVLFLARGSLLILLPAVLLIRGRDRKRLASAAGFAGVAIAGAMVLVTAFTVVHDRFLEDPLMARPGLGVAMLFWGNNPESRPDEWYDAELPERPLAEALSFIREQPGAWIRLKAAQALAFFQPDYSRSPFWVRSYDPGDLGRFRWFRLPLIQDGTLVLFLVPGFVLLWVLVIVDVLRRRVSVALPFLGLVVVLYASTYVVTAHHFRYRFPLNPLFYLLLAAVSWRLLRAGLERLGRWFPALSGRLRRETGWKAAAIVFVLVAASQLVPVLNHRAANARCGGEEVLLTGNADVTGFMPGDEVRISSPSGDHRLHPEARNPEPDPLRELVDGLRTGSGDVNWEDIYWEGDWDLLRRQVIFAFDEETCLSRVRLAYARPHPNYRIDHVRVFVSREGAEWGLFGSYAESERAVASRLGLIEIDTARGRWRFFDCDRRARFVKLELRINRGANFLRLGEVYLWGRRLARPSFVDLLTGGP